MNGRTFVGVVTEAGALKLDDAPAWSVALAGLRGKRVEVHLETERAIRTNPQLRRYFKCIVPVVRGVLNSMRDPLLLPLSKEQTHRLLCGSFIGYEETALGLVPIESKKLKPGEFAVYCDKIEGHYHAEGVRFPDLDGMMEVE